ncbi:MAG: Gfo/Idh/MocA family oxidoreductase [Nitrospirae bacterium YQR-1]
MGVIGTGYFGRHHARVLSKLKYAQLSAISDVDLSAASELGRTLNVRVYENYRQILKDVDAVVIATPTATHHKIAMECMSEGRHVFVEKPIAADIGEAVEMIQIAQNKALVLQVGHIERFNPGFNALSKSLAGDTPVFIETERISPVIPRALNVDVTLDLMIHDIDIAYAIAQSEVKSVRVSGAAVLSEKIDVARAWIEFENGVGALLTSDRLSKEKRRTLRVTGMNNFLSLDYITQELLCYDYRGKVETAAIAAGSEPLKEELMSFTNSVINAIPPVVSGHDGQRALGLALEISAAIRDCSRGRA